MFCGEVNATDKSRDEYLAKRKKAEDMIMKGMLEIPKNPVHDVFKSLMRQTHNIVDQLFMHMRHLIT